MDKQEQLNQIDHIAVLRGEINPSPREYFEDYLSIVAENPNNGITAISKTLTSSTTVIRDVKDPSGMVWVENFSSHQLSRTTRISTCDTEGNFYTAVRKFDNSKPVYESFIVDREGNEYDMSETASEQIFSKLNINKIAAYAQASIVEESTLLPEELVQPVEDNVQ